MFMCVKAHCVSCSEFSVRMFVFIGVLMFSRVYLTCINSVHHFCVVDTSVDVRFHVPTATWISDAVKEKLFKRVRVMLCTDVVSIVYVSSHLTCSHCLSYCPVRMSIAHRLVSK